MHLSRLAQLTSFTTLDGSTIREIAGPAWTPARNQSLAEATVPAGAETIAHLHRTTEELYFFTAGSGRLRVGDDERAVGAGDCAVIPPGTPHKLWADASEPLVLLCCCSPAYSDEDTELLEAQLSRSAADTRS
ncbi:MAG: cupin domain-containing protein [Solirubrobacteraceae bacterium]